MINFFRTIRQQLLAKNKFSKYLFYAIGEILLVMIGILLAFQVNNWNDNRKADEIELNILKELKQNLMDDIEDIEENISFHERGLSSSQLISSVIKNHLPYHDTLDIHFTNVFIIPLFIPTTTAFTNLKQNGTEQLENDSLRFAIISLYERDYVFLKDWIGRLRIQSQNDLFGFYRTHFNTLTFFDKSHPVSFEKLVQNQVYNNYINHQIYFSRFSLDLYYSDLEKINQIVKMIDLELNN